MAEIGVLLFYSFTLYTQHRPYYPFNARFGHRRGCVQLETFYFGLPGFFFSLAGCRSLLQLAQIKR